ncbi:MAG: hypothetical protein J7K04_09965, partial [Spirochaetales bacterium]|nr:hypothetical protein [Spirochaetales bacterium]
EISNLIPSSNFYTEIHKELQNADNLVYNFYFDLLKGKNISNFQILYLFPPDFITKLKAYKIGKNKKMREQELLFLTKLPKAELHCHLGGIATPAEIVETALENKLSILNLKNNDSKYRKFLNDVRQAVRNNSISELIELVPDIKGLRSKFNIPEPYSVAGFLLQFKNNIDLLSKFIYRDYLNNSTFKGIGIDNYEKLGDLQGSGLLQNELSIRKACKLIINKALKHNVHYLELRCSPVNYTRADLTEEDVVNIIVDEISKHPLNVKLIFIASRHGKMSTIYRHIELATKLLKTHKIFKKLFVGFDLAGNENSKEPNELSYAFLPLMEQCVKLTIHAGETEKVNNIWQAVYRLNADRIGHGLKLVNNKELLAKFRDRKIAVEMCPSSNNQIVGFHNFNNKNDKTTKIYPLKNYINEGLRVTINTDNPGISLTDFSQELFVASMLTEGGLSIWDILQLIKNSFRSVFTSVDERHDLIVNAEKEISKILQKEFKSGILST